MAAQEQTRHLLFIVAGFAALAALPAAMLWGAFLTVPLIIAAVSAAVMSARSWRDVEKARRDEDVALASVGLNSYLGYQIARVNTLVTNDQLRKQMMSAAEAHRSALAEWKLLAGEVPLEWAIEHRGDVRAAAARARATLGGPRNPMAPILSEHEEAAADIAHLLAQQIDRLSSLGKGGESLPALLDDPLEELDASVKPGLLEFLLTASRHQQLIYLTEDPDVVGWARAEAILGELRLIEPTPTEATTAGPSGRRRSRHVVA